MHLKRHYHLLPCLQILQQIHTLWVIRLHRMLCWWACFLLPRFPCHIQLVSLALCAIKIWLCRIPIGPRSMFRSPQLLRIVLYSCSSRITSAHISVQVLFWTQVSPCSICSCHRRNSLTGSSILVPFDWSFVNHQMSIYRDCMFGMHHGICVIQKDLILGLLSSRWNQV